MSNQIYFAKEAIRKLRIAADLGTSVYLYGATGFGKTSAVEAVFGRDTSLWCSCDDAEETVLRTLEQCGTDRYIVLDDLHCVEGPGLQRKIVQMVMSEGYRMVLIGRAPLPAWLSVLAFQSKIIVIPEDDLRVTCKELTELCKRAGVKVSPERMQQWLDFTEGNIMALSLVIRQLRQGAKDEAALEENIQKAFSSYLDEEIISGWSRDIQIFLMQVSVVDSFTLEMAEYITGDDGSALLLSRAERVGNILSHTGGKWRIRPVLLETLRERALKTFGRRRYNQLLYHAGRYEEIHGNVTRALAIYQQCGETDSIRALLVREARKHAGVSHFWALRHYYQALSEADAENEPVLMTAMSVLYSVMMNTPKSEYWYSQLKKYAAEAKGDDRSEANAQLAYLDVVLPHRGSGDLIRFFKNAPAILRSGNVLRPVSLTNNQPSVMNGGKDFCQWSKTDVLLANTLGPIVEKMLGQTGVGLVQTAMGESTYEKGGDRFKVLSYLTKAQSQCENNGIIEMTWVDTALQAKLALCTGDIDYANRLTDGMLQSLSQEDEQRLFDSVKAFSCWLSLYKNETGKLRAWLQSAPDEAVEFCTLNRYLYTVKIFCYIALGKHTDALVLISRMVAYADYAQRTYIQLECALLNAIILRRTGNRWKEDFLRTLEKISDFHFVPILSEKGAAILPLLTEVKSAFCQACPQEAPWFRQVLSETTHMARLYPNYLKGTGIDVSSFSDTALEVLRLQAAGLTTMEIAQQLHISQRTVKYHASENYRKLDAKNLVDAVQIAQSLNML